MSMRRLVPGVTLRQGGFTLVELVIVLFLTSVLVSMIGVILVTANCLGVDVQVTTTGTALSNRVADTLARQLSSGVDIINSNDTSVVFQEPVDADGDGDVFDAGGNIQWGAEGILGWTYEYVWIERRSVDEHSVGLDLNSDGDSTDEFPAGEIVLRVLDAGGVEQERRTVSGGADVLQSKTDDIEPIFAMPTPTLLEVTLTTPVSRFSSGRTTSQSFSSRRFISLQ